MFYPVESLKKGGRFYLCWVADSWPLRFATITHRQLWSQDIRTICDELIQVIINESGRATNRYSLRLSSQLLRGLVRLYQKKVNVFLSDLCMINANVTKHANRKLNIREILELPHRERAQILHAPVIEVQPTIPEEPELEPRVEELLQNSGNVIANIQEITLKETAIPEFLLPPNDGFGEENPDQAMQLLVDRTIETMLDIRRASGLDSAHISGLDLGHVTDKSHDTTRLFPRDIHMESISGLDTSVSKRSGGDSLLQTSDFGKDIPEIPDVLIPEIPVPQEKLQEEPIEEMPVEVPIEQSREETGKRVSERESQQIELEELEEMEPRAKRRKMRKRLIIDKHIKLSAEVLRARTRNPRVELRCEDHSEDVIEIHVPYEVFMQRPCSAGHRLRSNLSTEITRMYMRNLGVVGRLATERLPDTVESAMPRIRQSHNRTDLERIEEVEEPTNEKPEKVQLQPCIIPEINIQQEHLIQQDNLIPQDNLLPQEDLVPQNISVLQDITILHQDNIPGNVSRKSNGEPNQDISDMLTQKIPTLSQGNGKRAGDDDVYPPAKVQAAGVVSFHESMRMIQMQAEMQVSEIEKQGQVPDIEIDKENIPANYQSPKQKPAEAARVTAMLMKAGLADVSCYHAKEVSAALDAAQQIARTSRGSRSSETPLGSLDRTKVSLGSERTTDSKRLMRENWGTEGTMLKILNFMREYKDPVTVENLITAGPVLAGLSARSAAKCFNSILKLVSHGFLVIQKRAGTTLIENILLGPMFHEL